MDIEIDITDDRHFIDVAPVVDREEFAEEIKRLRTAIEKILPNNYLKSDLLDERIEKKIDEEVEKSRRRLFLPKVYSRVINAVAFRNKVTDADYSPAYLDKRTGSFDTGDNSKYPEDTTPDETYSIVLSPGVRDGDVLKVLQQYRDQVGNVKGTSYYKFIPQIWEVNQGKPSLRKYRAWYKSFIDNKKPKEIAKEETDSCPFILLDPQHKTDKKNKPKGCTCFDESTISKGIKTYKELLLKTPTL